MKHVLTLLTALLIAPLAEAKPSKPNIIFVLFDDLGYGQPQSYNAKSALRAPNFDKLAALLRRSVSNDVGK